MTIATQVREYFKAAILSIDSKMEQHLDFSNFENVPRTKANDTYQITIESIASVDQNDSCVLDSANVIVRLYTQAKKASIDDFDSGLNKAHSIRMACIRNCGFSQTNIKKVVMDSLTPEPFQNNDNLIVFTLRFRATALFKAI